MLMFRCMLFEVEIALVVKVTCREEDVDNQDGGKLEHTRPTRVTEFNAKLDSEGLRTPNNVTFRTRLLIHW